MARDKEGQVTVFIVIALVLISIIIAFFLTKQDFIKTYKMNTDNIESFVQECIEKEGIIVIDRTANYGGYYFSKEPKTDSGVPIYTRDNILSKGDIEQEISFYLEKKLFFCTRNFVDFPDYEIKQGKIEVNTKIEDEKIEVKVSYPLSIKKENNLVYLKYFSKEFPVKLGKFYTVANEFINVQENYEEGICLNCLLEIALKYDVYVDMVDYNDNIIFIIKDEDKKTNDEAFRFLFAVKNKGIENES